jgi:ferric-dicitrate binding protein FerR (iron transport regulator)
MAEHDDSDIARVLRVSGGRVEPSDDVKQAIYAAVHAEWRDTVAKRQQRRTRRLWLAAAASIAVAAIALFMGRSLLDSQGELMANVSRSVGTVQVREGDTGSWQRIASPQSLHVGENLQTGSDGRIALALEDGVSLRLDHNSRIAFVERDRIDVSKGAVYVDSGTPMSGAGRLNVGTPAGVVRHVGTQYEARILKSGTRVRVREGRVDVLPANGSTHTLQTGEQITVSRSGVEERSRVEPASDEWDWASSAAPYFDIEGRPVHELLAWAGREMGLQVVFASPESAAEARRAVLSGSVAGLSPQDALVAVLPTTNLRSTERDGKLLVELIPGTAPDTL